MLGKVTYCSTLVRVEGGCTAFIPDFLDKSGWKQDESEEVESAAASFHRWWGVHDSFYVYRRISKKIGSPKSAVKPQLTFAQAAATKS